MRKNVNGEYSAAASANRVQKNIFLEVSITDNRTSKMISVEKESRLFKAVSNDFHDIMNLAVRGEKEMPRYWYVLSNYLNDETLDPDTYWDIKNMPEVKLQVGYYKGVFNVNFYITKKEAC